LTPVPSPDWRNQWLSVHDLARLMGKSYWTVNRFIQEGTAGVHVTRIGGRIWVRLDDRTYDSLIR